MNVTVVRIAIEDSIIFAGFYRSEIFVGDQLSIVSAQYISFVQGVQASLVGSLNFAEDLCRFAADLKENLTSVALSPLSNLYTTQNIESLFTVLDDVCKDTDISEDTVKEG